MPLFLVGPVHTTIRKFENASNAFRPRYAQEILKPKITGYFRFAMLSFQENAVLKTLSVQTKAQSGRFQIPQVRRASSKSYLFMIDQHRPCKKKCGFIFHWVTGRDLNVRNSSCSRTKLYTYRNIIAQNRCVSLVISD